MFKQLFSYRSHLAAVVILVVLALVLTQVPLFNYLGYEFSAVVALFWSLIAGLLTISLWNKTSREDAAETGSFLRRSIVLVLAPLLLPGAIITANALFVKNCSFLGGTILFLLTVVPAVLLAHAFGFLVAVGVRRWKKSVFVFSWLVTLLHIVFVTFTGPQIFAFNPIIGYFPGLTYDESLEVVDRLLLYRLGTLAAAWLFVLLAEYIHRRRDPQPAVGGVPRNRLHRSLLLMLAASLLLMFFFSDEIGLSSSESSIEKELGSTIETDHFVITYPDSILSGRRLDQVVQLHEYCYSQITRALRTRPARKIHTFLYASAEQKGRLVGAAGTNIAKPWLWQLHINLNDVDVSLKHELVHVFAADFGFPLLRVGINSGLIEGLAVAVERVEYEEPVHRLAALAVQNGLAPDVGRLFSLTGFMKSPAAVSYVVAGSFCRYLIDRYGMRRFKLLYRTGEFEIIYGRTLPTLVKEWERFLGAFRFQGADRLKAEYLFKRRSIFGKECARVIATLNKETRQLLAQRRTEEALASAERSLKQSVSVDAVLQKTTALVRLGRYRDAVQYAEGQLSDSTTASSFLTLRMLLGDALWGIDSVESALKVHAELLRSHLSMSWDEALSIRLEVLLNSRLAGVLKPYYLQANDDSARIALLRDIIRTRADEPMPRFLLARELIGQEHDEEALGLLDAMRPLSSPILELARQRRMAQLSFVMGRYEQAKIYFWQSLNHVYRDSQAPEIEEKLRFCEWMLTGNARMN